MPSTARRSPLLGVLLACACPGTASTDTDPTATTDCAAACSETGTTGGDPPTTSTGADETTGEPETTTTDEPETTTTTGEMMPACEAPAGVPPPFAVDGVAHVLLDLRSVDAKLVFDTATREIHGAAVVEFAAGSVAGFPLFDLRQHLTVERFFSFDKG